MMAYSDRNITVECIIIPNSHNAYLMENTPNITPVVHTL